MEALVHLGALFKQVTSGVAKGSMQWSNPTVVRETIL